MLFMADRDVVVVQDGDSGLGMILGIIAIIAIVAAVWYFALGPGAGTRTTDNGGTDINVNLPSLAPNPS
jgi:hypothetical protein